MSKKIREMRYKYKCIVNNCCDCEITSKRDNPLMKDELIDLRVSTYCWLSNKKIQFRKI